MRKQVVARFRNETDGGALRYREVNSAGDYIHGDREGAILGDIYFRKSAMPDKCPEQIKITVDY
jgi:hypothetical protein